MCATEQHPSRCQTLQAERRDANPTAGRLENPWATPLRPRTRRRVLYPPLVRRPLPTERPDPARRWLLLLSALLFLQIYTEEVPCCAWDPLQADAAAVNPQQQHPLHHHHLQECEALAQRGDLLPWGPAVGELDTEPCCELSGSLPTQAERAGA
ncbi:radiation-inducible immediate-early gene IEX-1-like [Alosa alosa]|uniref:radiation-inducible immediate-early gene IEX-1-like n=1 Tax=Alosa alosa TaxID=278164 RepID=UPI00201518B6|nr:radiation-inducible immediate-early gene IEX-1-like [Alosa alosa]